MPQTSENPRKMKKISRVIWSYLGFKVLNPEVQLIASRSITTPLLTKGVLGSMTLSQMQDLGSYQVARLSCEIID